MDKIVGKDEELVSIENCQLLGYMQFQDITRLFSQVAAPQEVVMDAMLIKHLCTQQVEQMSANIA